jgi:hypothetical protein
MHSRRQGEEGGGGLGQRGMTVAVGELGVSGHGDRAS